MSDEQTAKKAGISVTDLNRAKEGFDPQFGARPLKRTIQDLVLDPLATKLLLGEFKPGDRIKVVAHNGELEFEKK